MNKIFRKRLHMNTVEHYVCKLRQEIFKSALDSELSPIKVKLFKKYNRYLKLLKFQNMDERLRIRIKQFNDIKYGNDNNETRIVFGTLTTKGTVTTAPKEKE